MKCLFVTQIRLFPSVFKTNRAAITFTLAATQITLIACIRIKITVLTHWELHTHSNLTPSGRVFFTQIIPTNPY